MVFSQVCKTVNAGTSSARCAQTGAACSVAPGVSGHCQFFAADRVCDCQASSGGGPSGPTAIVSNVLSNPVYVNLYWDASWDADNPTLPNARRMRSRLPCRSSTGGSEHGVQSASFGGSFLPIGLDQKALHPWGSTTPLYVDHGLSIVS
jgi:hypothetical protein